jgi:hypothetical protein
VTKGVFFMICDVLPEVKEEINARKIIIKIQIRLSDIIGF